MATTAGRWYGWVHGTSAAPRALAAAAVAVACALADPGAALARETVTFSYQSSSTLIAVMRHQGILKQRLDELGFDAQFKSFTSGLAEAINAGSVDFHGDIADAATVFTLAAGAPVTYYARETSAPSAQAIIVPADSPIKTVADLKGRSVAVSKGSGTNFLLNAALARAGLTNQDIEPRYLRPVDAASAFRNGRVDAWSIWDPFLAIEELGGKVRVLSDGSDGLALYTRYFQVTTSFAKKHPEVVQVVFDTLRETGKWVKDHPDEAAELLAPIWGDVTPEVVKHVNARRSYEIVPVPDAASDQERQRIADVFFEAGLIPAKLDAASIEVWTPTQAVQPTASN